MNAWLPGIARDSNVRGAGGGSQTPGPPKIVLHTTEGGWDSSMSVFRSKLTSPHFLVDPRARRAVQLLPLDRSGYALRHPSGTPETNRLGRCVQIEIVGFAGQQPGGFTPADLTWFGETIVGPIAREIGCPLESTPTFYGEGCGWVLATETARQRLSWSAWVGYAGVIGHQHVPGNSHWDPGAFNVAPVLAAARGEKPFELRKGSKGLAVAVLEAALVRLGHHRVVVDGTFGQQTEDAVVKAVRALGLTPTRPVVVGPWALAGIVAASRRSPRPRPLTRGSVGPRVHRLRSDLRDGFGQKTLTRLGGYGPELQACVKNAQRFLGEPPSGNATPEFCDRVHGWAEMVRARPPAVGVNPRSRP